MKYKFVFNASNMHPGTNIDDAVKLCLCANMEFLLFNGVVWFIYDKKPIRTIITVDDII